MLPPSDSWCRAVDAEVQSCNARALQTARQLTVLQDEVEVLRASLGQGVPPCAHVACVACSVSLSGAHVHGLGKRNLQPGRRALHYAPHRPFSPSNRTPGPHCPLWSGSGTGGGGGALPTLGGSGTQWAATGALGRPVEMSGWPG